MATTRSSRTMFMLMAVSAVSAVAGLTAFRGEGVDIYCPGYTPGVPDNYYWYKQEYMEGQTPDIDTRFAIYTFGADGPEIHTQYLERGVTLSTSDGHLHFPEVLLSDAGGYTCVLVSGLFYGVDLSVHVRPSGVSLSLPGAPVVSEEALTVTCTVDEILPAPEAFHWDLEGVPLSGTVEEDVVDATYNVLSLTNTLTHVIQPEDSGRTLSCVVQYEGGEIQKGFIVDITDDVPVETPESDTPVFFIVLGVLGACVIALVALTVIICRQRYAMKAMKKENIQFRLEPKQESSATSSVDANGSLHHLVTLPKRGSSGAAGLVNTGNEYEVVDELTKDL